MKTFLAMEILLPKIPLYVSDHFTIANPIVNTRHFHQWSREGDLHGLGLKSECSSDFSMHL